MTTRAMRARAAGFAANESCAFIDTLFTVAEAGRCKFAFDARATVSLCRATAAEERFWSAMSRVHHGPRERTALMYAADRGDVARVSWLLARGAPRDARDCGDETALYRASAHGHAIVVSTLLTEGAGVDVGNDGGVTPLLVASHFGKFEAVRTLLAAGANVRAVSGSASWHALHHASSSGVDEIVCALLAAGADVDARLITGASPLHVASSNDHLAAAVTLLAAGADRTLLTDEGLTALACAKSDAMRALLA